MIKVCDTVFYLNFGNVFDRKETFGLGGYNSGTTAGFLFKLAGMALEHKVI